MPKPILVGILLLFGPLAMAGSADCAACHRGIWETYRKTGMGRSFYRLTPANIIEDFTRNNTYYHKPSDSYFTMLQRDGKYFQRRHQLDSAGRQINVMEKQIDYVMGSGNHVRAYVHRTPGNKLIELPLAWYTEKGGYWAMNPGFDQANHDGFRRAMNYDCMFCHNAYPPIPAGNDRAFAEPVYGSPMPEGIDCTRCHGAGTKHVQLAATAAAKPEAVRAAIVNPARLNAQSQLEVCIQCHLESTSFPLPNSLQRYGRTAFSYKAGEPLSDYMLFFDHAPGKGRDDKFEIVNSVYRLQKSACFLQSKGKLGCTTCHNPHDVPRGHQATTHYNQVCRQCHATTPASHSQDTNCIDCHMPKRRTEDVVHVVMTDHLIQRRKPAGDLLAERAERHETEATAYRGEVVPYYPKQMSALDLALAQVIEKSNLKAGIGQLKAAIDRYQPKGIEYHMQLAEALRENGELTKALPLYEEVVRREPKSVPALQKLGVAQRRLARATESETTLKRALALAPANATSWRELGLALQAGGKRNEAIAALEKAIALDPDMSEAHNNLGVIWYVAGDAGRAKASFQEAIRIQPNFADAHGNLANLLSSSGDLEQARHHFETSLNLRPNDAPTRYNYAMVLGRLRQFDDAQRELEASLKTDPNFADAHLLLGDLLVAKNQAPAALPHYREAVRIQPDSGRAHLSLASALAATGDTNAAFQHLKKAAASADPAVQGEATQALRQLGK